MVYFLLFWVLPTLMKLIESLLAHPVQGFMVVGLSRTRSAVVLAAVPVPTTGVLRSLWGCGAESAWVKIDN